MKAKTCVVAVAGGRAARARRGACRAPPRPLESSIDWFWQTTQRSARPISRARASSAGSFSISDGSTARAGKARSRARSRTKRRPPPALSGHLPRRRGRSRGHLLPRLRGRWPEGGGGGVMTRPSAAAGCVRQVALGERPAEMQAHDALGVDQVGLRHARQAPVERQLAVVVEADATRTDRRASSARRAPPRACSSRRCR